MNRTHRSSDTESNVTETVKLSTDPKLNREQLCDLYASVGWAVYTAKSNELERAVANSTYVVAAMSQGRLVGMARCLSDDVSVFYLQDILVRPDWQRQGVGSQLLNNCLRRFNHVRQKILLTDDEPAQHRFYRAMGYTDIQDIAAAQLHAFVQIDGLR